MVVMKLTHACDLIASQFESCRADTTKTSDKINTFGIRRAATIQVSTFIDINALAIVTESKSIRTIAFIRSNRVHTLAVATVICQTLVHIYTRTIIGQIQIKAFVAIALRSSIQRFTHMRTATVFYRTRIRIEAFFSIVGQPKAGRIVTFALHTARHVHATLFTLTIFGGTFVNIEARDFVVVKSIAIWTTALIAAFDIDAKMRAVAVIPFAFVNVHARH